MVMVTGLLGVWVAEGGGMGFAGWHGKVKTLGYKGIKMGISFLKRDPVCQNGRGGIWSTGSHRVGGVAGGLGPHTLTSGRAPEDPNVLSGASRTSWG